MKRNLAVLIILVFSISAHAGEFTYSGTPQIIQSGQSNQGVAITNEEHEQRLQDHQVHVGPDPGPDIHETKLPLMTTTRTTEYYVVDKHDQILKEIEALRREQRIAHREQRIARIVDQGNRQMRDIQRNLSRQMGR